MLTIYADVLFATVLYVQEAADHYSGITKRFSLLQRSHLKRTTQNRSSTTMDTEMVDAEPGTSNSDEASARIR